jgi:cytochrome c
MRSCAGKTLAARRVADVAAALLFGVVSARSPCAADLSVGQKIFARCQICHTVVTGAPSKVGPNLHGLFGRKAGSVADFAYSPAMKASGITWDDATLAKFLRDPRGFIPGNRMAFPGIKDKKQLADLIAYLKQATR